jgi:hypothetical protein
MAASAGAVVSSGPVGGSPWLWKRTSPWGVVGSWVSVVGVVGVVGGALGVCAVAASVVSRRVKASLVERCR